MEKDDDEPQPRVALTVGVVFEASLALAAFALGALLSVRPFAALRLDLGDAATGLVAAVPMLGLFILFQRSRAAPFVRIRGALDEHLLPVFRDAGPGDILAISALAGIGEEMLFRGALQAGLAGPVGAPAALAVASVLFGLAHAVTLTYALAATVIGAWFGWLFASTGNLLVPVVAHAAYDFVALTLWLSTARRRA